MLMEIYTKGIGMTIKQTDMEFIRINWVLYTKVNGRMTNNADKASKNGLTVLNIRENIFRVKRMDPGPFISLMDPNIKENLK